MMYAGFALNGIDPDGEDPPDEVSHSVGEYTVWLCRDTSGSGWLVRVVGSSGEEVRTSFDSFEAAFAEFVDAIGKFGDDHFRDAPSANGVTVTGPGGQA